MGDDKMVSAEEARGLLEPYGACEIRRYVSEHDDECRLEYIGDAGKWTLADEVPDEFAGLLTAAPDLARTVIALHKRLEGVGVVECLAARDAATRERERANKAEQALAREKKNAAAREGLLTRRTDALRAAERELDEAREQIASVQALSNHPKGTPAETVHDLLCESERLYDMAVSERDEARAERDRLRAVMADLRSVVATYHPLACVSACRAARSRIDSALATSATVIAEQAADAAQEVTRG